MITNYKVAIRKNETGEVRLYNRSEAWIFPDDEWSGSIWLWTGGNQSCSCNLCDYWHYAGTETEWESDGCCTNRFTPLYAELEDGRRIEIEERWIEENGEAP